MRHVLHIPKDWMTESVNRKQAFLGNRGGETSNEVQEERQPLELGPVGRNVTHDVSTDLLGSVRLERMITREKTEQHHAKLPSIHASSDPQVVQIQTPIPQHLRVQSSVRVGGGVVDCPYSK